MRPGEVWFVNGSPNLVTWARQTPEKLALPRQAVEDPALFRVYRDLLRHIIAQRLAAD